MFTLSDDTGGDMGADAEPVGSAGGAAQVEPEVAPVWVRWSCSARDGRVHAFPLDDSQRGR